MLPELRQFFTLVVTLCNLLNSMIFGSPQSSKFGLIIPTDSVM